MVNIPKAQPRMAELAKAILTSLDAADLDPLQKSGVLALAYTAAAKQSGCPDVVEAMGLLATVYDLVEVDDDAA